MTPMELYEWLKLTNQQLFLSINNSWHTELNNWLIGYLTWLGDGIVVFPLMIVVLLLLDRQHFWKHVLVSATALVIAGLLLHALKYLVHSPRPLLYFADEIAKGTVHVNTMFQPLRNGSFPSGHTQTAFSVAHLITLLAIAPRSRKWIFALLYVAALMVGISRIYVGAHFPVDVFGGMIVGILTSHIIVRFFQFRFAK